MTARQANEEKAIGPLYGGWLHEIAKRFADKICAMQAEYNFDLGDEFEMAICEVLREVLPERAAVCRGFIVDESGKKAGDDIIVYDAARFPTLRSLGRRLEKKEQVPAEAVLAYIEAKRTLYIDRPSSPRDLTGQHVFKAMEQIETQKSLTRAPVPLNVDFAPLVLTRAEQAVCPDARGQNHAAGHLMAPCGRSAPLPPPSILAGMRLNSAAGG